MATPSPAITATTVDVRRLRAALRILLAPDRADAAAERVQAAASLPDGLRALADDLDRERRIAQVIARLPRLKRNHDVQTPTGTFDGVAARALLGLLSQLGVNCDGEQLEDAFGLEGEVVGRELLLARAALGGRSIPACHDYGWIVGRYRDRVLPSDERVRLLSHAKACTVCREALEQAQQVDATLLAAIEREAATLPETSPVATAGRTPRRLGNVALAAGSVVALLLLVAGISTISGLFTSSPEPVPLFTGEAPPLEDVDGWLLQVSPVGYLEAVNLATGQKRGLDSGDSSGGMFAPLYRVSRTHIAAWRPSDGTRDDVMTIGPIGEQIDFRLTWSRQRVYWYPSGWLDDDTLLIVKSPEHIPGETEQRYIERISRDSRVIAFDARTGAEQVLMTGNVAAAFPSPDGTMLAIQHPIDRRWPGQTIELRPLDGQVVGEPVVVIEHRVASDGFWLADSSAYVTSVIADDTVERDDSAGPVLASAREIEQIALERISREGERVRLVEVTAPESIVPMASSPDSQAIVYQVRSQRTESRFAGVPEYDWRCYRLLVAGGEPELLTADGNPERLFMPVWSPDGTTLVLPVARAFPLSVDASIDQPLNPNATTLLLFPADWRPGFEPQVVYSSGRDLFGWLPPGSIEALSAPRNDDSRALAAVEPATPVLDQMALSADSVVAANGSYVVASNRGGGAEPVIWNVGDGRQRRLPPGSTDLAWFNRGRSVIGVAADPDGSAGNRIVVHSADISSSAAYLDYRAYDPAKLGDSASRRYALPLVSPNETLVSFFVVNRSSGHVSLWLDGNGGPAEVVAEWSQPGDRVIEPPLAATWVRSDTLLFARPDGWQDGLPGSVVLSRLVIEPGGVARIDDLARLDTIHGARGVSLVEFAISPDASQIAYRLRHYSSTSDTGSTDDTLHVAGTDDLGRAIEIERGGDGEGLFWTSAGDRLVASVRNRIALYSPDGRERDYLSPRGVRSSFPILVGERVWFEGVDDRGGRIWQVDLP